MKRALALGLLAATAGGCGGLRPHEPAPAPPAAHAAPSAQAPTATQAGLTSPALEIVRNDCLAGHTVDLLKQQRLTEAQWAKTIDKMHRWGAPTEAESASTLATALASTSGTDSGPFTPEELPAGKVAALFEPPRDGPFGGGDRERGLALYRDRCLACHEEGGRGGPGGIALAGRQVLDRAADFSAAIRLGRGRMPEFPDATDPEVADLLSYLRSSH